MAVVILFKNQFSQNAEEFEIPDGIKLCNVLNELNLPKQEVFNQKTKKTEYKTESFSNTIAFVNGVKQKPNYKIKPEDVVTIYLRQFGGGGNSDGWNNFWEGVGDFFTDVGQTFGSFAMAAVGVVMMATGNPLGVVLFLTGGFGFADGLGKTIESAQNLWKKTDTTKTYGTGDESEALLALRGGKNQSVVGQRIPFVIGQNLLYPLTVGSPYTQISSKDGIGDVVVQKQLMIVGYSPLKVTDIKFEENIVAYNKSTSINGEVISRPTVFHGKLKGIGESNEDGDIVKKWKNNDIEIEILQGLGNETDTNLYGTIYPQTVKTEEVNANIIHIYDKNLEDTSKIVYKNVAFTGGFRTNTVHFSASCPSRLEVELDLPSGLFATDTYSDDSYSEPRYYKIPCNIAVQWRFINKKDQISSTADNPSGWVSFTHGTDCSISTYSSDLAKSDINQNKGLTPGTSGNYNTKWWGTQCFTLGNYDGTSYKKGNVDINQRRYVFSYDFSIDEAKRLCGIVGNDVLDKVEVRVVRLTPMFLDEQGSVSSDSHYSNRSYQDLTKWSVLRTFCFDKEEFINKVDSITSLSEVPLRPMSREDMGKFCVLAISAKPDQAGTISNAFEKVNVIATSLSPNYVNESWVPQISKQQSFFMKEKVGTETVISNITEEEYFKKIENGEEAFKVKKGNNFDAVIKTEILNDANIFVKDIDGYYLPQNIEEKYVSSNPASGFLLTLFGGALGNEAKDYSDVNLSSLTELYNFCEDITDGTLDENSPDGLKHLKYSCDGIISSEQKLGTVLTQILFTGRSTVSFDDDGKLRAVIDKPKKYPEMVLSQQNCISGSNTKSLVPDISGFSIDFTDKEDNYDQHTIYVMADGEDYKAPKKEVSSYRIPFVTNREQIWSLGRYILGSQFLQKEIYNRVVGKIGRLLKFGSYVLLRDETLSVGTDKGGRIEYLIEDNNFIYGFVIDDVYEYTGELENGLCKKGFVLVQPQEVGPSRCVTLRMCTPDGIKTQSGELLKPTIGQTNLVLLEKPISKDTSQELIDGQWVNFCPKENNLVEFGNIGNITREALVMSVKPNNSGTFNVTLCQYNADIYNYGKKLPVLQGSNSIIQSTVGDYEFVDFVDKTQIQESISNNLHSFTNQFVENKVVDKPEIVKVVPNDKGIELEIEIFQSKQNAIQLVEWEVDKGNGFEFLCTTDREGFYTFRKNEHYEKDDLNNWIFRARVLNIYNVFSEYSEMSLADLSSYGTWQIGKPNVSSQVLDRSAFLTLSLPSRSDNKTVYGNIRYKIVIQRIGNKDIEGTEDYVEADTDWYKPATSASWQTSEDNYKQGSAVTSYDDWLDCSSSYSQTLPLVGQTNKNSVATEYRYKVVAYNEAGYSTESDIIPVTALPTNIADLVHSNENYKDLYVERLSAISANVGLISQGGFGSFEIAENYWALSKLFPEETGLETVIEKGAFRVGGKDQYIWVEPVVENGRVIDYTVSVKAGNFIITSLGTQINGELIVQKSDVSDERTRITPSGTYFERKVGSGWQIINRFDTSGVLSPSYRANNQILLGNFTQTQQRELGHDIGRPYLSENGRVWHFDEDFNSNDGTLSGLELAGEYDLFGSESSNGIDYTPAIKAVAPYCQIARCIAGNFAALKTIEATKTCTVDFWMQYIYAESQQLFSIGTIDDRIELNIQTEEPVYCVSGACSWRSQNGDILYTSSRNPTVGAKVYYDLGYAEEEKNPLGEISSLITSESWLVDAFIFDGSAYYFENGDADYNWETFAPEDVWGETSVVYNRAAPGDVVLSHIGQSTRTDTPLKELDKTFDSYKWQHIGVVFTNNDIIFLFDDVQKVFTRNAVAENDIKVSLNTSKTKIIIDELYIDTAVEDVVNFFNNTLEKLPWGALSRNDDWFIFDAKDLSKIKSNILDKVKADVKAELLNSSELKQLINDVINNN